MTNEWGHTNMAALSLILYCLKRSQKLIKEREISYNSYVK
jgi:hypothetical protein